jgi:hypothetical protein
MAYCRQVLKYKGKMMIGGGGGGHGDDTKGRLV